MLNTRLEVAKSVGCELIELEKLVDGALIRQAKLQVAAIEGRRKAKLPLDAGQVGLEQLAAANANLIAARKAIHDAHMVFRDVQFDMGLGAVSYGDYGDTPPPSETKNSLRLAVADAA